jgi:flap endonuclease-1
MGVKLQPIIIRDQIKITELAGKIIAIDAPNIIMGLFNFARKNPDGSHAGLLLDHTQRPISHLYGLLYRIYYFYSKNIFPIFCFDGKVSQLKKIITKDQLKDYLFMDKWYRSAIKSGRTAFAKSLAASRAYQWQTILQESKLLLSALGVPYINSPASAESQCAQLVKDRVAHYSNSQDFDSLVFRCPHVVQNLSKTLRRKVQNKWVYNKISPVKIDLKKNLKQLGIDQFQLVDMTILIGCDYFSGIRGIGPKRALNLIRSYDSLEKIIRQEKHRYNFSELDQNLIMQIRKIFLIPDVLTSYPEIIWNLPHEAQIEKLLLEVHALNKERVQNNLNMLTYNYKSCRKHFLFQKDKPSIIQKTLNQYS